ncbi:polysaccharide deacetylase family protein [Oryzomonas sagensis]|uniref:Polysaccharide deacetylase family protein n=1 Tax=Oryzomonas sagensis TaxID=2603857 RepID=A0ABQ6TKN3_9BACT|nr:polysaccharide deacetylase family protein [Oryzomonas sagensis]KAB0668523.1 polysaccharide deacetylase family protein [Oryzomonas sagensis]
MPRKITIVMYHFVRDLKHSRYPGIKGLDLQDFVGQVGYMRAHYTPITMEELIHAARTKGYELPPKALLLTFDDGYIDHFTNVFPVLDRYGIQGCFFPPAKAVTKHLVLDVNKIHFVLASVTDKARIIQTIFSDISENQSGYALDRPESYYERLAVAGRYDTADVVFIKRILQKGLPEELRARMVDKLFAEFVTGDEAAFARELYMDAEQLECMRRNGMFIGSHGYDHYWLDSLSKEEQEREIDLSLEFLGGIGCDLENWVMCYPYGGYNDSLLSILAMKGCRIGLSVSVGIADLERENPLALSRLDTNDLPKRNDAGLHEWTRKIMV